MKHRDKSGRSETDIFAEAMSDVVRLRDDSPPRIRPGGARRAGEGDCPRRHDPAEGTVPEVPVEAPDVYLANGADRRQLRKLARGDCPIQDTLDLHGRTLAEAESAVRHFIQRARHQRRRYVCVITGVGHHSPEGAVLKPRICDALRANPAVLGFTPAPPAKGGKGALYVWVRR